MAAREYLYGDKSFPQWKRTNSGVFIVSIVVSIVVSIECPSSVHRVSIAGSAKLGYLSKPVRAPPLANPSDQAIWPGHGPRIWQTAKPAQPDASWYCMVSMVHHACCGTTWYITIQHGSLRDLIVQHDTSWYSMIQGDPSWHNTVQQTISRCNMIHHDWSDQTTRISRWDTSPF